MLIAGNWKMYKGPATTAEFCLALRDEALGGPKGGGLVALGDRVGERPDRLFRGIGDDRLKLGDADGPPLTRPQRQPL